MRLSNIWKDWWWLIALIVIKLALQLVSAGQYGFHRDEYLYFAQAEHLAWGYLEVPPAIAFVGAFIRFFGDNLYWIKLFPALIGSSILIFIALMVREMGGKRWAQATACIAFILVPAFLRTHHLFQPVFLNQFMWVLLSYFIIRLIKTEHARYWYFIGIIVGIGMLTKYSIAFPIIGFAGGLLLTNERKWMARKEPYIAAAIALLIFLPNMLWQYNHNFPIIAHMEELRQTQLVHVQPLSFITGQFLMLFASTLLWMPGVVALFGKKMKKFRLIGWMYVILLGVLLVTSGKMYYTLGIYPVLIAAGAVWWEGIIVEKRWLRIAIPALIVVASLGIVPYGIPVLPVDKMMSYCAWMSENMGLSGMLVWEDGIERPLPQDFADMYGWEEMVSNVSKFYHTLSSGERASCNLWGGSYAHAGAMLFYADKYDLPKDVTSFNGSFVLWAKKEADFDRQIMVDDRYSLETPYFRNRVLVDSTHNIYARDPGYIYYQTEPLVVVSTTYRNLVRENQARWLRK
jgi:dolichyl-phosphate-mannose-protein mannosyltransferase